jgi:glutathione peroxidase
MALANRRGVAVMGSPGEERFEQASKERAVMPTLYDFQAIDIEGNERKLSDYAGKLCLIVNVASECGLTPQYDGLQRLYGQYRQDGAGNGLEILAFPCNQFGAQEPGENGEIEKFCRTQYGVEFSMFAKVDVNGETRIPLYAWLTAEQSEPEAAGEIAWNFAKFLIDHEGHLLARFAPTVEPCSTVITDRIDEVLKRR